MKMNEILNNMKDKGGIWEMNFGGIKFRKHETSGIRTLSSNKPFLGKRQVFIPTAERDAWKIRVHCHEPLTKI